MHFLIIKWSSLIIREAILTQIKDFLWNHFIKWRPPRPLFISSVRSSSGDHGLIEIQQQGHFSKFSNLEQSCLYTFIIHFHFHSVFNVPNRTRQYFCMNYIDNAFKFLQDSTRFFRFLYDPTCAIFSKFMGFNDIKHDICIHLPHILSTPCPHLAHNLHTPYTHLAHILHTSYTHLAHILHMSWTHLAHILSTSCTILTHILHTSCAHLAHILHTSCTHTEHTLHTSCAHLAHILCTSCTHLL